MKFRIRSLAKNTLISLGTWFFNTSESFALMLPGKIRPRAVKAVERARNQARKALEKGSLTRVFLENLGYRTSLNLLTKVIMFFIILWLTRVLSPRDFGLYSFSISTAGLFAVFAGFGVPGALMKKIPEYLARGNKEEAGRWALGGLLVELLASLAVFSFLFLASSWLSVHLFNKPFTRPAIKLAAGFLFLSVIAGFVDVLFVSLKRNDLSFRIGAIKSLVIVLGIFSLVSLGYSYIGAVYGYMLGIFAFLALGFFALARHYRFLISGHPENPVRIVSYSWWFLALGISASILSQTDIFMISIFMPIKYAGYYRVAVSLVSTIMFLIPVGLVTMPIFSEAGNRGELERRFKKVFYPTLGLSLGIAVLLAVLGKFLLGIFYPGVYVQNAWVPLIFLAFLIPARNAFWLNAQRLIVLGQEKKQLIVTSFAAVLNIILNALLIPWLGLVGAALASVTSLVVGVLVAWWWW